VFTFVGGVTGTGYGAGQEYFPIHITSSPIELKGKFIAR